MTVPLKPVYRVAASGDPSVRAVAPVVNANADALIQMQEMVAAIAARIDKLIEAAQRA